MPQRVPGKAHLIPVRKQIKGKSKTYFAIRYLAPEEAKKEIHTFLSEREKESKTTRYLTKHPFDVEIVTQQELKRVVPKNKSGEQYYLGHNVKETKRIFKFKKPEEISGIESIVCLYDGRNVPKRTDTITKKRQDKKFKRIKNLGPALPSIRAYYQPLLRDPSSGKKKQLATVLALMDLYSIRVGSGVEGVTEGPIEVKNLKRGMVIGHPSWSSGTPPHVVGEEKTPEGIKRLFIRSLDKDDEFDDIKDYRKQIKSLTKKLQKDPSNKEMKFELEGLVTKNKELSSKVLLPIPTNWKEAIRLGHYGATMLEARHINLIQGETWVSFVGKSGVWWRCKVTVPELAGALEILKAGKNGMDPLFPDVDRDDVEKYLKRYKILPKDFRPYNATKAFVEETRNFPVPKTEKELKQVEKELFKRVSMRLWNTPGMAKKAYVNPDVYATWRAGMTDKMVESIEKSYVILV